MSQLDQAIEKIKKSRPKVGETSLKTYRSILNSTFYRVVGDRNKSFDPEVFFSDPKKVISVIESDPLSTKKTRLASIVCLCDAYEKDCPAYREVMMNDIEAYKVLESKQEMTTKQKDNWLDWADIVKTREQMKRQAMAILNSKPEDSLRMEDIQTAQQYIILSIYTLIPPRRLLDYTLAKVSRITPTRDNYYDAKKKQFVFNQYKTASKYGQQVVPVPRELSTLLNKWIKLTDNDALLFDSKGSMLTQSQLSQRLNNIFAPRRISVNMLRHAYLTDQLRNVPALTHLQRLASEMAHSTDMQMKYRKFK